MKTRRPDRANSASRPGKSGRGPDAAFDIWLDRSLKALCDSVAAEPLPPELLRLVNEDRSARSGGTGDDEAKTPKKD